MCDDLRVEAVFRSVQNYGVANLLRNGCFFELTFLRYGERGHSGVRRKVRKCAPYLDFSRAP